jgi:alkanesulfonate monooxygenase SsuD/methylene tetrahydromethanopterin reductase-like flavin-dependent oxidoreductase (luciferase family)
VKDRTERPLGVTFPPLETRRDVIVDAAVRAEELGYNAFFVAEAWGLDALVLLAEIAARTRRILIGSAVVNVWSRSAATLTMAAATLAAMSNGRFILGLGSSTPQLVEGLHDLPYADPLDRLRRVLLQIRSLLDGERVPVSDWNTARPLRLGINPDRVPLYLAALSPGSVRLAGELADGWMPFFLPHSRFGDRADLLTKAAGRPDPCRICPIVGVAVAEDGPAARELAAWWVAFYLTTMGQTYASTLERLGFGDEVAAVRAANPSRGTLVVPADAERLFEELLVFGAPAAARERLARWLGPGGWFPILSLPPNRPVEEIHRALEALAPTTGA